MHLIHKKIQSRFYIHDFSEGQDDDFIKRDIKTCVKSSNCKVYTLLDKKNEKSLNFCFVVNGSESCYVSNCTCPNNARQKRDVSSTVHDTDNKDKLHSRVDSECKMMHIGNHQFKMNHQVETEQKTAFKNLSKIASACMPTTREKTNILIGDGPLRG